MTGHFIPKSQAPQRRARKSTRSAKVSKASGGAWDFGILPYEETVKEIRRPEWREAVDACQMLTSVAYQILRDWHELPPVPYIAREFDYINEDPFLERI